MSEGSSPLILEPENKTAPMSLAISLRELVSHHSLPVRSKNRLFIDFMAFFWPLFACISFVASVAHDSCHHEGCDASSMVQVKGAKQTDCDGWKIGEAGTSCIDVCGTDLCTAESVTRQTNLVGDDLLAVARDCFGIVLENAATGEPKPPNQQVASSANSRVWPGVFYQRNVIQDFFFVSQIIGTQQGDSLCPAVRQSQNNNFARRICYCVSSGPVVGDPHIQTLHGEHYTVLKQGTFLAWSFKSSTGPVEWQLFASYTGARSKTKGLLLIDHARRVMELTAQDCQWRRRAEGEWQKATVGKLNGNPGHVEVLDLNRTIKGHLRIGSVLKLKMNRQKQTKSVAKLVTHCRPGERLDFMVSMYDREDIAHTGGQLGHPKHRTENQVHFLSLDSKHMLNVKADSEFEVSTSWLTLGGSQEADSYLVMLGSAASVTRSFSPWAIHHLGRCFKSQASKLQSKEAKRWSWSISFSTRLP
eukprot:Skav211398  [mRNA]  locus=scaffold1528:24409:26291:- [translate_table: standard]